MTSDIIVIGGGIAGISAAARLSEHAQVLVLEAESALGYHASGRSAALFEQSYGALSVQALNRASRGYFEETNGGYLTPRGLMAVARKEEQDIFDQDVKTMHLTPISIEDARAHAPILDPASAAFAAYDPDAHDIDTDRLIQDFARTVRENNGQVLTGQRVKSITRDGALWRVTTKDNIYQCQTLVNAAGAWADEIAFLADVAPIGFTPCRRSMARVKAPEDLDVSRWPMIFGAGETWYAKPDAGALIVSPAEEDPTTPHDAYADDLTLAEGIARFEAHVTVSVTRMLSNWAGLRTFSPDRALVLGRAVDVPEFVWCAGQGGYGFQSSPAASRLLADLVMGRRSEMDLDTIAALDPKRFA